MRFNLALFILFIMAFSFVFSTWEDTIRVYAVDNSNRPIEGATIKVTYQKNQFPIYKDTGFDGESILLTNSEGYADFIINNNVQSVTYEIRYYYIEVSYGTLNKKEKVTCNSMGATCHPREYLHTFTLNTNRVNLNIKDQSGRGIEGAKVSYGGNIYTTDSTGKMFVTIPQNTDFVIVVDYNENKRTVKDKMLKVDKNVDVTFNRYNVQYRIINDEGTNLNAEVILNEEIKQTDEEGMVLFEGIIGNEIDVFVRFENGSREFKSAINQDINTILVMDLAPPVITNVFHEIDVNKNIIFVNAKVTDPNTYGTGLRSASPVKMRYKIGEEGWKTIEMYTTGKDAFQGTIPYEDSHILYEIEAIDAQDNIQKYNGKIDKQGTNSSVNNETDVDDPVIDEPKGEGFINTNTLIIGGVILLIIAFIGYKFYTGEI